MTIVGCFLEYDGRFVILLRHAHKPDGDTWGLPAGKVEVGEDNETAVLRELAEETGYYGSQQELEHLGDHQFGNGKDSYTFATYRIKLNTPHQVKVENSAHKEHRWVTARECYAMPNLIAGFHDLLVRVGFVR